MPIVLPNLDDKTFDGLVAEATAQIPALYPPWTDFNPSDPGITLIELFAWLAEMVIYRNNRITESTYRTFINFLVGSDAATGTLTTLATLDQMPLATLQGMALSDAIRTTVLALRQTYRAATVQDYQDLTLQQWPGSPQALALSPSPSIKRVFCFGEHNLGPAAATEVGATAMFAAIATLSDGSTEDVTAVATWSVPTASPPPPTYATLSGPIATGVLAGGTAQIQAALGSGTGAISGQATLTVGGGTLMSIALTPSAPSVAVGRTFPFLVTGMYSDGSSADLTRVATWSSGTTSVLTIDSTGHAHAVASGQSTVTAHVGTLSGSALVIVTPAVLSLISITPAVGMYPVGTRQQLVAVGRYDDGTVTDLTTSVTWSSAVPTVAFVSNAPGSAGILTAAGGGVATITAALGTVSGATTVTISSPTLLSIAITPASASIPAGAAVALTAQGTYSDGAVIDITSRVPWSSSASSIASVSSGAGSAGLVTAVGAGAATVTVTVGAVSGTAAITVTTATLVSIAITPSSPTVPVSVSRPLTAHGTYSDSSVVDLTGQAVWTTDSSSIATVAGGVVTGVATGTTGVHATLGGVSGSVTLTVSTATLTSIAVTPASPYVLFGSTQQMMATGTYSDSTTYDITQLAAWSTGAAGVATVSTTPGSRGIVIAVTVGQASITAALGAVTGNTEVTVPALVKVVVSPLSATRASGDLVPFTATAIFANQAPQDVTAQATWSSSVTAVATISAPGVVATVAAGTTSISAAYTAASPSPTLTGATPLTVSSVTVTALSVVPVGPPLHAPGHVNLIVAPDSGLGASPWLAPSPALSAGLLAFFEPRRLLTTHLHVTGPAYVPVTIAATLYLLDDAIGTDVDTRATAALVTHFHPWQGGPAGAGWPFGRHVHASEVYAVLAQVSGVSFVDGVVVSGGAPPSDPEHVMLGPHQLPLVPSAGILLTLMERQGSVWQAISL